MELDEQLDTIFAQQEIAAPAELRTAVHEIVSCGDMSPVTRSRQSGSRSPQLTAIRVAAAVAAIGLVIAVAVNRSDNSSSSNRPPRIAPAGTTIVELQLTSVTLSPSRTLFDLTGFENGVLALSPDGRLIVGKVTGDRMELFEVQNDQSLFDLGIELATGASLAFGPHGDLFSVESALDGTAKVSEFQPSPTSTWRWISSASAAIDAHCGIMVTPAAVGCPGSGPKLSFDPPVEYDRVQVQPSVTGIIRTGGAVDRRWLIALQLPFDLDCEDRACAQMVAPGPGGSAVWFPLLRGQQQSQAVFVLDDRNNAGAAWLDPRITGVVGVRGTDLIAVQPIDGKLEVVAVDLTPILG